MAVGGYFDDAVEPRDIDPDEAEDYDMEPPEVVVGSGRGASDAMERYFANLESRMRMEYELARKCRERGLDPETRVEIPPAIDLAARVEELVGPRGVAERIRELAKQVNREELSLIVAKECAGGRFGAFDSKESALDQGIRTGLAILTEGILVAPLEGIAGVRLLSNDDGTDCAAVSFAGPIRAAGGTGQALSVLIADVVRRELGIGKYVATEKEIGRMKEEIPAYKAAANLQYTPTNDEIELIMRNCPVMIDGEGTEKEEIGGNRDLPRIETNQIRGGACLVIAEGMTLKAPKIQKHVKTLKLEGWDFINTFVNKGKKSDDMAGGKKFTDPWAEDVEEEAIKSGVIDRNVKQLADVTDDAIRNRPPIEPNKKFLDDLIAGRPVFAYPSRKGGWRLRYGRARTGGLATTALHPAAMALTDDFLAAGTQMKIERPGKATAVTPCDSVEPPVALLFSGSLVEVRTYAEAKALKTKVKSVIDLGEMLIPYGEFAENNKPLPQAPWCEEWWSQHVERYAKESAPTLAGDEEAHAFAQRTNTPLHPRWTLFWHDITLDDLRRLSTFVEEHGAWRDGKLVLPRKAADEPLGAKAARSVKDIVVDLLALHDATPEEIVVHRHAYALARGLGLDVTDGRIARRVTLDVIDPRKGATVAAAALSGVRIMPRGMARVGTRMGRPEKAAERKMSPPVHLLFPIGQAGGAQRLLDNALKAGRIDVEIGERQCPTCKSKTIHYRCEACEAHTEVVPRKPGQQIEAKTIDLNSLVGEARDRLKLDKLPETVKAVQGLISRGKAPEPIEKGILRAKHDVWTFKDGTVRFDMININLTHFKPAEAHVSVEKLREMGYTHDTHGAPLERDDQVLELRVQDVIVSTACMDYMLRASQYVDEVLVKLYGFKSFYNCRTRDDLLGHLFVALAPHTSGGVLCRIIGYNKAQAHYGHPFFHASKRRNCLHPTTDVLTLRNGMPGRTAIEAIWREADGNAETHDEVGTVTRAAPEGIFTLAADPATGRMESKRVQRILRVPSPAHLLRITTGTGRSLVCSPLHRMEVVESGQLVKRKAAELRVGDIVPFPDQLAVPEIPAQPLDLLAEFARAPPRGLTVRGIRAWLQTRIDAAGGLKAAAASVGVTMKALDNHRRRDSVPWPLVARFLELANAGLQDVPMDARLAIARDTVEIPRTLPITPHLMRLVGYYLAEGHSRGKDGDWFQVSIAAQDQEIVADLVECWNRVFHLTPKPTDVAVTVSSRLVYNIFTQVFGLGSNAHDKCIPPRLAALPKALTRELLAAYFSGDGSVEVGRLHVQCTSVSRGLLRDIAFQLARHGIACRFRTDEREGGGAVAAYYERKGLAPRTFIAHRLSIRSTHAAAFAHEIGFTLSRKQKALESALGLERSSRLKRAVGDLLADPVADIELIPTDCEWLYDLEVEDHHNFLVNDLTLISNCDGDEDCLMLLLDGLLNFSKSYLPSTRGGQMDAPLTLTMRLDPSEVDKEAHNVDLNSVYPLEFFEATMRHPGPKEVEKHIDMVSKRLGQPSQYEGFGFTHDTADIAEGPEMSAYKTIGSMMEKMEAQLDLALKIRAVDAPDVAARVIGSHFLPDLMGNLKAFSKQAMRCPKCNTKYRRVPIMGKCRKVTSSGQVCGNPNLTMTVHEGSVKKYLVVSKEICERYQVSDYVKQRIEHIEDSIDSVFANDRVKKAKLSDFF